MANVKLQLLLKPESRNSSAIAATKSAAASLGLRPTASGAASISLEVSPERLRTLFGISADDVIRHQTPEAAQGDQFLGQRSAPLPVPEPLREHVETITVAPVHIRFEPPK